MIHFFNQVFSNPKRVKLFLDIFAKDVSKSIHSIMPVNTEKFSSKSQKFMLDLLFSCKVKDQDAYIRIVLEHKSYLDKELPVQLSYYNSAIWEEAIKEKDYYPPIQYSFLSWKRREEHTHIFTSIRRPKLRKICI